ncbi:hypothetical protein FQR65_LT13245 [Abscondita terminalis]|nr:hypothetical protein FQR65_LT13245 [Abscondita terminalis]
MLKLVAVVTFSTLVALTLGNAPIVCPDNEEWTRCGAACVQSCQTIKKPTFCPSERVCTSGCICQYGLIRDEESQKCVRDCPADQENNVTVVRRMHQPENFKVLYNGMKEVTKRILYRHRNKIQWKQNKLATVIDIGTASGQTTKNILYPFIEKNIKMLVGIDLCPNMVQFANDNYSTSKLHFQQGDVQNEEFVNKHQNFFDHAFSFWCLHWIRDKTNIWKIIQPGGGILLSFIPSANVFDVFRKVQHSTTWIPYLENGSHPICVTSEDERQLHTLQGSVERLGFKVNSCESDDTLIKFDEKEFKDYLIIVHPYYETLSEELKHKFIQEHTNEMMRSNFVEYNENGEPIFLINCNIITVYAQKISNNKKAQNYRLFVKRTKQIKIEIGQFNKKDLD